MRRTLLVMMLMFSMNMAAHGKNDCKVQKYELKAIYYEIKAQLEKGEITIAEAQKLYMKRAKKVKEGTC